MKGTVYFEDGHTEPITYYEVFDKHHVKFVTETGIYYFSHPNFYKEKITVLEIYLTGGMTTRLDHIIVPYITKIEIPI